MAKIVEVPEDRPLTELEYESLISHLRNSVVWYAMNGKGNTGQIKEKLKEKQVPVHDLQVESEITGIRTVNLWEETLEFLTDNLLVDDETYAERLIEREVAKGRGMSQVRATLWKKKVDSDLSEKLLERFLNDEENDYLREEGLRKALRAAENSSQYRRAIRALNNGDRPKISPRQAVVHSMVSKGFNYGEIEDFLGKMEWVSEAE